ncbi:hypothetical protein [Noviherbaspirillum cavernae]|uniref:hypothetical protein n=1 Tax=Noviherbaspirillum cavernae TaxID=2320862 RepID=UPI0013143E5C|nr:hypothetical protein [Noviherbaspirillum cavernae]
MKFRSLLIAALALPMGIASAQTTSTPDPFVPLTSSAGSTGANGSAAGSSTWFIDTTNKLVVLCAQSASSGTTAPPAFTCTAQAAPTSASTGTTGTGTGATGTTPAASSAAGINPLGR